MMKTETLAKIAVAYSGLVWGLFWIPLRELEKVGIAGVWATLVFYLVPAVLLLPVFAWRWRRHVEGGLWLVLLGLSTSVPLALYSFAMLYTEVVDAMLLFYLTPMWSTVLGRIFLGERITALRAMSIGIALLGMVVILGGSGGWPIPDSFGDWAALGSGFGWSVASVLLRLGNTNHALELTTQNFLWSAVAMILAAALFAQTPAPALGQAAAQLWWLVPTIVVVVMTGVYTSMWGAPLLSPAVVGLLFMTEISVGTVTAALWAGEPFGWRELTGVALISLAGVLESVVEVWRRGLARS